ncbi:MAG: hypothetical protein HC872_02735 [Gammaproteobacteria bacterium]|nr:hypothetical protein [Gammaproteobacteria bacterium]
MVPLWYETVQVWPLSGNGKVDRQRLPVPRAGERGERVGARTAVEQLLVEIWQQVLGLERVGIEENFFGLGGDSIQSIQVVSRAQRAGLQLSTRQMFEHQSIAELAAHLQITAPPQSTGASLQPFALADMQPANVEALRLEYGNLQDLYPATPMQEGMLFHASLDEAAAAYTVQLHLSLHGALDVQALQRSWNWLAARHVALRSAFTNSQAGRKHQLVVDAVELPPAASVAVAATPIVMSAALATDIVSPAS